MDASTALTFSKRRVIAVAVLGLAALALPADAQRSRREPEPERGQRQTQQASPARRVPTPPPARATVFFCETADVQCRTSVNWFGIDDIRDLHIFAAYRNVTGEHTQQVRLILPDGNTYQSLETKFTTLATGSSPEVQVAVRSQGQPTVKALVPVAGTHITQRSLAGTWAVELYLDGKLINRVNLIFQPRTQS